MNASRELAEPDADHDAATMLRRSTAAELDLLRTERKAERKLREAQEAAARDEAKLRKAEQRLAASRATVATAAEALRACQVRRAAGPVLELP